MNRRVWLLGLAAGLWAWQSQAANDAGNRLDLPHGKQVYGAFCAQCHDTGNGGAPLLHDAAAWQQRSTQAFSVMNSHAQSGFLRMPAKGQGTELTQQDVADAVFYMTQTLRAK